MPNKKKKLPQQPSLMTVESENTIEKSLKKLKDDFHDFEINRWNLERIIDIREDIKIVEKMLSQATQNSEQVLIGYCLLSLLCLHTTISNSELMEDAKLAYEKSAEYIQAAKKILEEDNAVQEKELISQCIKHCEWGHEIYTVLLSPFKSELSKLKQKTGALRTKDSRIDLNLEEHTSQAEKINQQKIKDKEYADYLVNKFANFYGHYLSSNEWLKFLNDNLEKYVVRNGFYKDIYLYFFFTHLDFLEAKIDMLNDIVSEHYLFEHIKKYYQTNTSTNNIEKIYKLLIKLTDDYISVAKMMNLLTVKTWVIKEKIFNIGCLPEIQENINIFLRNQASVTVLMNEAAKIKADKARSDASFSLKRFLASIKEREDIREEIFSDAKRDEDAKKKYAKGMYKEAIGIYKGLFPSRDIRQAKSWGQIIAIISIADCYAALAEWQETSGLSASIAEKDQQAILYPRDEAKSIYKIAQEKIAVFELQKIYGDERIQVEKYKKYIEDVLFGLEKQIDDSGNSDAELDSEEKFFRHEEEVKNTKKIEHESEKLPNNEDKQVEIKSDENIPKKLEENEEAKENKEEAKESKENKKKKKRKKKLKKNTKEINENDKHYLYLPVNQFENKVIQLFIKNKIPLHITGGKVRDAEIAEKRRKENQTVFTNKLVKTDMDIVVDEELSVIRELLKKEGIKTELKGITRPTLMLIDEYGNHIDISPLCARRKENEQGQEKHVIQTDAGAIASYFKNIETTDKLLDDALLRDINANALYFSPIIDEDVNFDGDNFSLKEKEGIIYLKGEVKDPTGKGLLDIQNETFHMIRRNVAKSFEEDPDRILRLIRLLVKTGFIFTDEGLKPNAGLDKKTFAAIDEKNNLLKKVNFKRLLSELENFVADGNLKYSMEILYRVGTLKHLFPQTHAMYEKYINFPKEGNNPIVIINKISDILDQAHPILINCRLPIFLASLLWAPISERLEQLNNQEQSINREDAYTEICALMDVILNEQAKSLPLGHFQDTILLIWRSVVSNLLQVNDSFVSERNGFMYIKMMIGFFNNCIPAFPNLITKNTQIDKSKLSCAPTSTLWGNTGKSGLSDQKISTSNILLQKIT